MSEAVNQIKIGAALDGMFDTTIQTGKRKMGELGAAAREAGKGTGSIGDGMAGSATKVEAATKNMVGSIQRQIAALEAGDKSSRQYQESLARMRGIDVAALRPYLDQLDQVKAKQSAAAVSQESFASGFNAIRVGAFAAAAAIGAFGMAFKNIVNGVDALNDLKDATGASIENISALEDVALRTGGSLDTVSTALVKLNQGLNAAKPGSDTELAIKAIGLSVEDLKNLDPAEAFRKTAVALSGFADDANKARLVQELFGKSMKEVAPLLKDLAEQGSLVAKVTTQQAEEAERFNKSLFEMQKNVTDISRDLAGPLVTAINEVIKKFKEGRAAGESFFQTGWKNYTGNVRSFWGVEDKQGGASGSWDNGATGEWDASKPSVVVPTKPDNKAAAAAKKALDEQNKALAEQAKLLAELSGYTGEYEKSAQRLVELRNKGLLTEEAYTRAITELVNKQPGINAAMKAESDILKETAKARTDAIKAQEKQAKSAQDALAKQLEANAAIGLSKEAIAELESATMLANAAELERQANLADGVMRSPEIIDGLKREAQAMRDLATAKVTGAQKQAGVDAAADMLKEQKKAAEESSKYWEDALMRAFESGKGFFQSLWDTIKNTLKTQVLKVTVQGVMGTLGIGAAGSAMAGESEGSGGLFSMISQGKSAWDAITSGSGSLPNSIIDGAANIGDSLLQNGFDAAGNAVYDFADVIAKNADIIQGAGQVLGYASALNSAMEGKWGQAAGEALGTYILPGIGTIIGSTIGGFVDDLFGGGGGPKVESSYGAFAGLGDTSATGLAGTYAKGVEDAWGTLSKQLEVTSALKVGALTSIDPQGDAQTIVRANATIDGAQVYNRSDRYGENVDNAGRTEAELQAVLSEETTRILFAALKASDLPEQYKTYLNTVGDSVVDMTSAMSTVTMVDDLIDALEKLPFLELRDLSFDAAVALSVFSGGMDALKTNLGTYYSNFYTAEEQRLRSIENINAATAGSGLDAATATRETFRELVESWGTAASLATEEGQKTYAALLGVSGGMGELVKASEDAAKTLAEAATKAAADLAGSAYDDLTRAIDAQRSIYEVQVDAAQSAVDEITSVFDVLKANVTELYGTVDSTVAMQAAQGNAFIDQALSNAQTTGYLPDSVQLSDAVAAARGGADSAIYASQQDADFARLELAGRLDKLKTISGDQLATASTALDYAQSQLDALTALEETAKLQLDAFNGISAMVFDIGTAMDAFDKATAGGAAGAVAGAAGGADVAMDSPIAENAGHYSQKVYGAGSIGISDIWISDPGQIDRLDTLKTMVNTIGVGSPEATLSLGEAAAAWGYTQQDIANAMGYLVSDVANVFNSVGLPSFAVGTNRVPHDMVAQIHQGEAIIPAAYNPANGGAMGNTARLEALVEVLTVEVQRLQAIVNNGNSSNDRIATAIEGNQSRPLLVEIAA